MKEEMHALRENDTFELTTMPKDKKCSGGRWVYAIKSGPNGEEKCKARSVAKGFSQVPNVNYHLTHSKNDIHLGFNATSGAIQSYSAPDGCKNRVFKRTY